MELICSECGKPENFPEDPKSELRPYGAGGNVICFGCATATPAAEERAKQNFFETTNAAGLLPHVIGGRDA